jgi:hypothetical protein
MVMNLHGYTYYVREAYSYWGASSTFDTDNEDTEECNDSPIGDADDLFDRRMGTNRRNSTSST